MPPRLGPAAPTRSVPAADLLPAAHAAGAEAGVTRLADITRLDRLGLPVWQAIRPMSRALSVHQGKGATDDDARLGALLEAVESDAAERFDEDGPTCRFAALPERHRAPRFEDFSADRDRPPDSSEAVRWTEAQRLGGGSLFLPLDLVSLDLTRAVPSRFGRTSNGVATGATRDEAILAALHELVERDALAEWKAGGGPIERMEDAVDGDGIALAWFQAWRARLDAARIHLAIHHLPAVTGSPMFVCELNDFGKDGDVYGATVGFGCHADPELALFRGLSEALQARLTMIAGARDDLEHELYVRPPGRAPGPAYALPLPPGRTGKSYAAIAPGPVGVAAMTEALSAAGYPDSAIVDLAKPAGLFVVRVFVCGLGANRRRRWRPA